MATPHPLDELIVQLEAHKSLVQSIRNDVKDVRTGGLHKDIDVRRTERRFNDALAALEDLISKIKRIDKFIEG